MNRPAQDNVGEPDDRREPRPARRLRRSLPLAAAGLALLAVATSGAATNGRSAAAPPSKPTAALADDLDVASSRAAHERPARTRTPSGVARAKLAPERRTVHVGLQPTRTEFDLAEPAGVILLLRLTAPQGTRATVTGTIPGLASVMISTKARDCRQHGGMDVCTQPEEWCPMPAATWRFRLSKLAGPPGQIRLDFLVGRRPGG
jgi:hypothetical protein